MAKWFLGNVIAFTILCAGPFAYAQDAPFSPDALLARYTHWQEQQITVAAYPALFMSPGYWQERNMEFGAEPMPQAPTLVVCKTLSPANADRITSADLVVLRGTFAGRSPAWSDEVPHQISLRDCEVLSVGGEMPQEGDPWLIGKTPIPIDALHDAVFELIDKTVRVKGFYWGRTWSGASDESRHDIQETAAFLGPKPIGCFQAGKVDAPQSVLDTRENTVVEGEVVLNHSSRPDRVDIANCRFILPN